MRSLSFAICLTSLAVAAVLGSACGSSHRGPGVPLPDGGTRADGSTTCTGSLECVSGASGGCCGDAFVPGVCGADGALHCPTGTVPTSECRGFGPGCGTCGEGPPVMLCYMVAADGSCCGTGVPATLGADCSQTCPAGTASYTDCGGGAIPPSCEPAGDYTSCTRTSECTLAFNNCCGSCGIPTLANYDAINGTFYDEHFAAVCPDPEPACPDCVGGVNPNLVAVCVEAPVGACVGYDLRATEITACTTDADCMLRTNLCCECGSPADFSNIIAIRRDGASALEGILCDEGVGFCPGCTRIYPPEAFAACATDGHCEVRWGA